MNQIALDPVIIFKGWPYLTSSLMVEFSVGLPAIE